MLVQTGAIAGRHVDTGIADILGTGAMGLEVVGEVRHDLRFASLAGEQQARGAKIVKQADLIVPAARGGFVDADRGGAGEVLQGTGPIDVMVEGSPDAHVADTEQLCDSAHRHRLT